MEEDKSKQTKIEGLFKAYTLAATIASLLILGIFWTNYLEVEVKNYCIPVPADQPHDFQISESNACLIDWWTIIKEPVLMSALFMFVLLLPFIWIRKLRRCAEKHAPSCSDSREDK